MKVAATTGQLPKLNRRGMYRKRMSSLAAMLFASIVLLQSGCKANATAHQMNELHTPRTQVPEELVGHWHTGNVTRLGFYDPTGGNFSESGENGSFLNFGNEGFFEAGGIMRSSWHGCAREVYSFKKGTVTVLGNTVTLYPHMTALKKSDSCIAKNNYEGAGTLEQERFQFNVSVDGLGNTILVRLGSDGQMMIYARE